MQCGFHLFAGVLICQYLPKRSRCGPRAGVLRYGVVLGAILPDIDLPVTVLMVAITGDEANADIYHRTFTHCIFFVLLCVFCFIVQQHRVNNAVNRMQCLSFLKSKAAGNAAADAIFDSGTFGIGLTIGLASHIVLDMLYMKGVAVFWPFSNNFYGYPPLGYWTDMSKLSVKVIEATDHFTDIALFIVPLLMRRIKYKIDKKLQRQALRYCCIKSAVVALLTALAFHEELSFETYFVLLYIPGTFFFVVSVLLPVIFRDALHYIGDPLNS